jgi:hypothetical protein
MHETIRATHHESIGTDVHQLMWRVVIHHGVTRMFLNH